MNRSEWVLLAVNDLISVLSLVVQTSETLMKLAVDWIQRCWHQNPDSRPAFAGILHELIVSVSLEESGYKYVLF